MTVIIMAPAAPNRIESTDMPDRAPRRTAATSAGPSRAGLAFAAASLLPVPLIAAGALAGGVWVWAALIYMTALAYLLDSLVAAAPREGTEFPAHNLLSVVLALTHFVLLALVVRTLSQPMPALHKLALFLGTGLFMGQISNSNAHELIHRQNRALRRLGMWVYVSLLFGHHTSAHPLVHHVHVATDDDPNSARRGDSFYRFLPRAWAGSFRAGLAAETSRRKRSGRTGLHPYAIYLGGGAACLAVSALIGGAAGILAHLLLAAYATMQLLLSDYVQHYGLRRARLANGRPEPVTDRHSWNAPHWMTSHMMLNAPRHSDHHAHPSRPYPQLRLPSASEAPMLPRSLPAMATLALMPPLWRRVMDPRLARWNAAQTRREAAP